MARVAKHHHKGHQGAACAADGEFAKLGPVRLCLLAGQGAKAQVRPGLTARAVARDAVAKVMG